MFADLESNGYKGLGRIYCAKKLTGLLKNTPLRDPLWAFDIKCSNSQLIYIAETSKIKWFDDFFNL